MSSASIRNKLAPILTILCLTAFCIVLSSQFAHADEVIDQGTCGENLTWALTYSGVLTISGSGKMQNCGYHSAPWYDYINDISAVVIEDGVTEIGSGAFEDGASIRSVTIPKSVNTIGSYAFFDCESIENIALPEGLVAIEGSTFSGCIRLSSVTIPTSVRRIEDAAFYGCKKIEAIDLPEEMTSLKSSTFSGCSSLKSIIVPLTVKKIEDGCFWGCSSLESLYIPDTVTNIGDRVFYHVTGTFYIKKGSVIDGYALNDGKTVIYVCTYGHVWNEEYTEDKPATCTEEGSESIHCSVCDAIRENSSRSIEKKPHAYGDWTTTKEAMCTEKGSKEKVCVDCGDKVTEEIAAKGHSWNEDYTVDKAANCTENGSESIHCSVCGEIDETTVRVIEKKGHTFGEWTTTKKPTGDSEGEKERICSECGEKETKSIDKLTPEEVAKADAIVNAEAAINRSRKVDDSYPEESRNKVNNIRWDLENMLDNERLTAYDINVCIIDLDNAVAEADKAKADAQTDAEEKAKADTEAKAKIVAEAKAKGSNINKATVSASDIKKASNLGATSITLGTKVKKIKSNAFKGTKITTVTVKSKKLKAKSVKGSLKGSKVKTIKVKVGNKKENKKYVKSYKKIFTKKNAGKKVSVK